MTSTLPIGDFSPGHAPKREDLPHYHEVGLLERLRDPEMPVERDKGVLGTTDLGARQPLNRDRVAHPAHTTTPSENKPQGDDVIHVPRTQQPVGSDVTEIRPFRVEISDGAINDLRERLARTRWPEKEPVEDWSMGIPLAYVQELAGYWAESYEMQRVANRLNRYEQFMTTIDGVDVHFLHVRSPVDGATPCLMTHGWPGSVMEFIKVIDPLVDPVSHGGEASDALELVIPSLPGYGWSGKPTVTGWNVEKIAQAWIELMDRLGYERWVAQGGDWGAIVAWAIGRLADPAKLIGIHFNFALADPAKLTELGAPDEEEQRDLASLQNSSEAEGGYAVEQGTKPHYGTPVRGGHFAAYEAPAEFVAEVRAGLRALV